ncbi:hypothetical protein GBA63_05600 [Rubrobacter tropicus]|uniref:Uncharacterized protein n=1 Tax=Rubrobacter tropicus TaxID=2653851 RepID=A0A6G8Q6X4_9ACTN|nr:hypothetical protein [Rubrobacter tropicus]QIN82178.1 hypothetical protein GBA63_05600 [Rubrobacter tropicus]
MAGPAVVTLTGSDAEIEDTFVEWFGTGLWGGTIQPRDAGYEGTRRVWVGLIDKRPALVACRTGVAEAVDSVDFARGNDILLAALGGHSFDGNAGAYILLGIEANWEGPSERRFYQNSKPAA